jgi:hypothetical protein
LRFEKADFLRFQIAIFKSAVPKRFMFCNFDLKSHLLSMKSQSQTHPNTFQNCQPKIVATFHFMGVKLKSQHMTRYLRFQQRQSGDLSKSITT